MFFLLYFKYLPLNKYLFFLPFIVKFKTHGTPPDWYKPFSKKGLSTPELNPLFITLSFEKCYHDAMIPLSEMEIS